ncbi:hypothetical protein D3C76_1194790 [compost metagenome]
MLIAITPERIVAQIAVLYGTAALARYGVDIVAIGPRVTDKPQVAEQTLLHPGGNRSGAFVGIGIIGIVV